MIKRKFIVVLITACAILLFCGRGRAEQVSVNDAAFLSDYIDAMGLVAQLRVCIKCADSRPQPTIDSVGVARAFLNCYQSAQDELRLAKEMVLKHSGSANPQFKELAERTGFLYGQMFEVIQKSSRIYESIYEMWRSRSSNPQLKNKYHRDLISLDDERMELATLLLTVGFRIQDEEKRRSGQSSFSVTKEQGQVLLKRLEGYFGPEVKKTGGSYRNALSAAVFYEELSRQKADQPVKKKTNEVYINAEYGIEFPVPDGYRWKQMEHQKSDSYGRTHIQLGIASMDLSGDDPARFGNAFITMSVYEYPHDSPVTRLDMPEYVLATLDPKTQKLKSGIAIISINGFPAAYYLVDESVSAGEYKDVSSLILLVRLSPFKVLELVATTLPKAYFDAYRLEFEEAFLELKIIK